MQSKVRNEGGGCPYLDHVDHVSSPWLNQPQKLDEGGTSWIEVHKEGIELN